MANFTRHIGSTLNSVPRIFDLCGWLWPSLYTWLFWGHKLTENIIAEGELTSYIEVGG
jgi:hypothetical protein